MSHTWHQMKNYQVIDIWQTEKEGITIIIMRYKTSKKKSQNSRASSRFISKEKQDNCNPPGCCIPMYDIHSKPRWALLPQAQPYGTINTANKNLRILWTL